MFRPATGYKRRIKPHNKQQYTKMKKALKILIITIASLLILNILLVVVVDPFYHYHDSIVEPYVYSEVYQSPGMAKHFTYDTVMLGSSMTENFRASWFNEYGQNAVKLSYSGARSADIAALLNEIFKSGNNVSKIYIDVNDYQLTEEPTSRYGTVPEYLYDDNLLTDVQYIFNKDVVITALTMLFNKTDEKRGNIDEAFTWSEDTKYGAAYVTEDMNSNHENQAWINTNASHRSSDEINDTIVRNLQNLIPFIEEHPETEFIFFYPPYSAAYWVNERMNENVDNKLTMYENSIEQLLNYDNAKVYFFMDDYEHIGDLDNYRDMCHFKPEINRYMLECMNDGRFLVKDASSLSERLDELGKYVSDYEMPEITEYDE